VTDAPVSPLRRRMIEDMTIRKMAARTQQGYIRAACREGQPRPGEPPDMPLGLPRTSRMLAIFMPMEDHMEYLDVAPMIIAPGRHPGGFRQ
jgi:hypothetical protein